MSDTHFELPKEREFSRPGAAAYVHSLKDEGTAFGLACCLWRFVPDFLTEDAARARWVELCGADDADAWRAAGAADRKWVAVLPGDDLLADSWELTASPFGAPRVAIARWLRQSKTRWMHWQGQFWRHNGRCYEPVEEGAVRSRLSHDFALAAVPTEVSRVDPVTGQKVTTVEMRPVYPNTKIMAELVSALRDMTHRQGNHAPAAGIAFRNGVLTPATGLLAPVDRDDFRVHCVEADYDPAATCPNWESFVASALPDEDQQALLQEVLGYLLSGRRDLQKMFCWTGKPRAGKGTILRVVEGLMGTRGVAGVSLADLASPFGLEPCRTASVIALGEARIGRETRMVVDLLLRISGEDTVTVNIKNKPAVQAQLPGRVVLLSNELPAILEDSGALASRFVHLDFQVSFLGREDLGLGGRLAAELPGIAVWALSGLARLTARGHFPATAAGQRQARLMGELSNHEQMWLSDRVEAAAGGTVPFAALEQDYQAWCDAHDVEENIRCTPHKLGRMLTRAGLPAQTAWVGGAAAKIRVGLRLSTGKDGKNGEAIAAGQGHSLPSLPPYQSPTVLKTLSIEESLKPPVMVRPVSDDLAAALAADEAQQ